MLNLHQPTELDGATCVEPTTHVCERLDLLEWLVVRGRHSPSIILYARHVRHHAERLAQSVLVRQGDWYRWLLAHIALDQVHRLPYVPDPPKRDCYRNVELTARRGGECKALNVFYVALLLRLGIRAEVWWIMQTGRSLNHVASKVFLDGAWWWADASIKGARIGESPYEALERTQAWHVVGGINNQR